MTISLGIKNSGFSFHAFQARINAAWFRGHISDLQSRCLSGFISIYLIRNILMDEFVPESWLAYVLATTYHETGTVMVPIAEYGLGNGHPYGEPDPVTGQVYYGRGYVQLTWKENYQKAEDIVIDLATLERNIPFVMNPDLALEPIYAAQIALSGMAQGWFTGKKLSDYLSSARTDYVNARRIINGTDKAELIASYAKEAEEAIRMAQGEHIERDIIKNGSQGDDVCELQLALGETPDGIFGTETDSRLRKFQTANGLIIDGICGNDTWNKIEETVYNLQNRGTSMHSWYR